MLKFTTTVTVVVANDKLTVAQADQLKTFLQDTVRLDMDVESNGNPLEVEGISIDWENLKLVKQAS